MVRSIRNLQALLAGMLIGGGLMFASYARADVCTTNPGMCTSDGKLVIDICTGSSDGSCNPFTGSATQGGTSLVGQGIDHVSIGGPDGSLAKVPINPSSPLPTPPGWTDASTPPGSAQAQVTYCTPGNTACAGDPGSGLTAAYVTYLNGSSTRSCYSAFGQGSGQTSFVMVDSGHYKEVCAGTAGLESGPMATPSGTQNVTCPAGYSVSGTNCTLSDANQVEKPDDGKCGIQRSGNTYTFDSRDNDCSGSAATDAGLSASGDTVQASSTGQNVKIKTNTDGSTTITIATVNSRGNTDVQQWTVGGPPAGGKPGYVADGNLAQTYMGSGSLVGGTALGGMNCDGCAQDSTLQQTNAALNDIRSGNGAKINEQGSAWATDRTNAANAQAATTQAYDSRKSALDAAAGSGHVSGLGIGMSDYTAPSNHEQGGLIDSLFPTPTDCSPITFAYRGGFTFDPCPAASYGRPILNWMMYALTVLYIYALFWRRNHSAAEA